MRQLIAVPLIAATLALAACSSKSGEAGNSTEPAADAGAASDVSPVDGGIGNTSLDAANLSDNGSIDANALEAGSNSGAAATNAL